MFPWSKKQTDRERLLKDFRSNFPNARRPNHDDSIIEITFLNLNGMPITLKIYLTEQWPDMGHKPVFQVLGPVVHPWLDQSKRVIGSTKLLTWNPSTSSLSETTKEIIQALAGAPQSQTQSQTQTQASNSNKQINPNSSLPVEVVEGKAKWVPSPIDNEINIVEEKHKTPIPEIPSNFPDLQRLETSQLQRLLNDDIALKAHIEYLKEIIALNSFKKDMIISNGNLADQLLKKEELLVTKHAEISAMQFGLKDSISAYNLKSESYGRIFGLEKHQILSDLKKHIENLDTKANTVHQNFERGNIELSKYVQEYVKLRSQYHTHQIQLNCSQSNDSATTGNATVYDKVVNGAQVLPKR